MTQWASNLPPKNKTPGGRRRQLQHAATYCPVSTWHGSTPTSEGREIDWSFLRRSGLDLSCLFGNLAARRENRKGGKRSDMLWWRHLRTDEKTCERDHRLQSTVGRVVCVTAKDIPRRDFVWSPPVIVGDEMRKGRSILLRGKGMKGLFS